ncbi:MAG TPA: class I SAM-dependent methyltransferase [Opitutaceae bacterium]|nr:class I SAM-dependent methyltransferase [Opitutaceae bacterium]
MDRITLELIAGVPKNGPTDPIDYYRRPVVGRLFRRRINLGLELLPARRFSRALEVGYGSGGLLLALAGSVDELHGIDLDAEPESVRRMLVARGRRATLVQGTVDVLPYAENSFELIVCFSVFEHLADYRRALGEVQRVLAPGGLFLLGMPAVNRTMEYLFRAIGHSTINDIHITTPRLIRAALAPAGFRLVAYRPLDVPLPPPFGLRVYHNWLLEKPAR